MSEIENAPLRNLRPTQAVCRGDNFGIFGQFGDKIFRVWHLLPKKPCFTASLFSLSSVSRLTAQTVHQAAVRLVAIHV